jgi:hypothetical protein
MLAAFIRGEEGRFNMNRKIKIQIEERLRWSSWREQPPPATGRCEIGVIKAVSPYKRRGGYRFNIKSK